MVQAFKLFGRDGGSYIGLMLISTILYLILSMIPSVGSLLTTLVCAPMVAGVYLFARSRESGNMPEFSVFFGVFSNRHYLSFVAQNIFISLITVIAFALAAMWFLGDQLEQLLGALENMQSGKERDVEVALDLLFARDVMLTLACGLIVSIVTATIYFFAPLFVILRDEGFWPALESSRKFVISRFWDVLIMLLSILLLNVVGVMLCCVGLLVTIPISYLAIYLAFADHILSESSL